LYQPAASTLSGLILMPEWHLVVALLSFLTGLGLSWKPLFLAAPPLLAAFGLPLVHAIASGLNARFPDVPKNRFLALCSRIVVAGLHLLQPVARLVGRLRWGLTPWRRTSKASLSIPRERSLIAWSETWGSPQARLQELEAALKGQDAVVRRGGDFDDWDLEVRGGLLGSARLKIVAEEHGQGKQLVRLRVSPRHRWIGFAFTLVLTSLTIAAARASAWVASGTLLTLAILPLLLSLRDCSMAVGLTLKVTKSHDFKDSQALYHETPVGLRLTPTTPIYVQNVRD
jgi:hypothetical protein